MRPSSFNTRRFERLRQSAPALDLMAGSFGHRRYHNRHLGNRIAWRANNPRSGSGTLAHNAAMEFAMAVRSALARGAATAQHILGELALALV